MMEMTFVEIRKKSLELGYGNITLDKVMGIPTNADKYLVFERSLMTRSNPIKTICIHTNEKWLDLKRAHFVRVDDECNISIHKNGESK